MTAENRALSATSGQIRQPFIDTASPKNDDRAAAGRALRVASRIHAGSF